jgi:hypothetical protein
MIKFYLKILKKSVLLFLIKLSDKYFVLFSNLTENNKIKVLYKSQDQNVFFGYNDRSPLSRLANIVLAHRTADSSWNIDSPQSPIDIGYFRYNEGNRFNQICKSNAWSLQQGSMLQFLPTTTDRIIFNDFCDMSYCARVYTIDGELIRDLPFAYYSISSDLSLITSIDFERLSFFRDGYGYKCKSYDDLCLEDPVAYKLIRYSDLSTYREVTYEELVDSPEITSRYYVNHLVFSPSNELLAFFLIYEKKCSRYIIMFIHDIINDTFHKVITEGMPSHFCWKNPKEFVVTVRNDNLKWSTILYCISDSGEILNIGTFSGLNFDSHPAYSNSGNLIIERAHLNFLGKTSLYCYSSKEKKSFFVEGFRFPSSFRGPLRSDLHHRVVRNGQDLHLDIVNDGVRCSAILSMDYVNSIY